MECLPQIAEIVGIESFNDNISENMMKWIEDTVFAVREATLLAVKQISGMFGESWIKNYVFPVIKMLVNSPVFMKRMTALSALNKFGELLGAKEFYGFLEVLGEDEVPNVRFNVAKTIKNLFKIFKGMNLAKLLDKIKNDSDPDVKFFAEDALKEINKKN